MGYAELWVSPGETEAVWGEGSFDYLLLEISLTEDSWEEDVLKAVEPYVQTQA